MYIWNTKALADDLVQQNLTQSHYKNYYLGTAILLTIVYYYAMYSPYYNPVIVAVEGILTLLIMYIGINKAYTANGGEQGQFFIKRVTALSFPILVQNSVIGIVFALFLLGAYEIFNLSATWFDQWYEWCVSAFTIFLQIVFFTRLVFYMRYVVKNEK